MLTTEALAEVYCYGAIGVFMCILSWSVDDRAWDHSYLGLWRGVYVLGILFRATVSGIVWPAVVAMVLLTECNLEGKAKASWALWLKVLEETWN